MSWIQKLYETYEQCKGREPPGSIRLMPISHTPQQAHIEITLDADGCFKGAKIVQKEETIIPATEKSTGRTGSAQSPHPLCDKVQYCAADYSKWGGTKASFYKDRENKKGEVQVGYETQLAAWCISEFSHPKAKAVLAYVQKGSVVTDLVAEKVLHTGADGKLLTRWSSTDPTPDIFRLLTAKDGERDQGDAFIRWHVREANNPCTAVWEDVALQAAWARFDASTKVLRGVCMVTGEEQAALAMSHPKRLRHAGDGAKLISANDASGYTFRGRFTDDTGQQACGLGYEITQKAHNALRWLIQRQAYRNEEQVIVTWAVAGKSIPDPFQDSLSLILGSEALMPESEIEQPDIGDAGQAFGLRLKKAIAGYRSKLDPTEDIVVMGLDSATPGRMAITYYRELQGSEFLDRIQNWHEQLAWPQNFGKESRFIGAPAPRDIAEAAFSTRIGEKGELRVDDKLRKATVERLLPCIIDGRSLPRDLVDSVVRRASNRNGLKHWEWEKFLGIACALFKGFFKDKETYQMTLETERTSPDYLYGRLLAIADSIESYALKLAEEGRETTAARMMQRFADRPFSTWRNIELALSPYKSRLRSSKKTAGFLVKREKLLDEILCSFQGNDFSKEKDRPLSGEFLLGYHCQRQALNPPKTDGATSNDDAITE